MRKGSNNTHTRQESHPPTPIKLVPCGSLKWHSLQLFCSFRKPLDLICYKVFCAVTVRCDKQHIQTIVFFTPNEFTGIVHTYRVSAGVLCLCQQWNKNQGHLGYQLSSTSPLTCHHATNSWTIMLTHLQQCIIYYNDVNAMPPYFWVMPVLSLNMYIWI